VGQQGNKLRKVIFFRSYYCSNESKNPADLITLSGTINGCKWIVYSHYNSTGKRYAEVLLSYLEAELEAGNPITQELLDQSINLVRGRASVALPPITETDPSVLRELLRKERRIELAFEGTRLWDIFRGNIGDEVLTGDFWGAPFPESERYPTTSIKLDPQSRWYVTSKNFRPGQDDKWPIPESETNINPKLAD
jgi:hypothetical protein